MTCLRRSEVPLIKLIVVFTLFVCRSSPRRFPTSLLAMLDDGTAKESVLSEEFDENVESAVVVVSVRYLHLLSALRFICGVSCFSNSGEGLDRSFLASKIIRKRKKNSQTFFLYFTYLFCYMKI